MACRGSGVRVPSPPPSPQVRPRSGSSQRRMNVAQSHLLHSLHPTLGPIRTDRPASRPGSAVFAHLRCMEPATTSPIPTTAPLEKAVVVTGVFEPALSVQPLAEELHVSAQTIYDLRSQ